LPRAEVDHSLDHADGFADAGGPQDDQRRFPVPCVDGSEQLARDDRAPLGGRNRPRPLRHPRQGLGHAYDVWLLANQFTFDGALLAKAVAATFANRDTAIDAAPIAFTPDFTEQPSTLAQWTAFRNKLPDTGCPEKLSEVVTFLAEFLSPIARACESGEIFDQRWAPGGPWTSSSPA
jgi:hypothetical protein